MSILSDLPSLAILLFGALTAGFTTGFAGFGTGLVASGFWFHALPAPFVPPMVAMASVAAQAIGLIKVRKAFDWKRAAPFLLGGLLGVPLGVWALGAATPGLLRTAVGAFLIVYAVVQLGGLANLTIAAKGGRGADGMIGVGGGFLGGFAGLSGPLPLVWLQLRGGPSDRQRAIYQPFNLIVLGFAVATMGASGQIDGNVVVLMAIALPATLIGAWIGAHAYLAVSERLFRRIVLMLLMMSGGILVAQAVLS